MSSPLVTLRIPASLSALGASASCLGLALDSWSTAEVWASQELTAPEPETADGARARQAMEAVWKTAGVDGPSARVLVRNDASPASAVGTREASIVAGLMAANDLAGGPMEQSALLALGVELGGRAQGLAASLLGGLQMATAWEGGVAACGTPLPLGITLVLFLLEETPDAEGVPIAPAPQSALDGWRVALLVNAMASSRLEELSFHEALQPNSLYPHCPPKRLTCAGAMIGGALAALPAREGGALVALTRGKEMTVAYEMAEAARQSGLQGVIKIARPSTRGAYIASRTPAVV